MTIIHMVFVDCEVILRRENDVEFAVRMRDVMFIRSTVGILNAVNFRIQRAVFDHGSLVLEVTILNGCFWPQTTEKCNIYIPVLYMRRK